MTPFWIVNFMEKGSVEPFFETYWRAFLQNNSQAGESDKFYCITDATDEAMTKEDLQEIASQRLSRNVNGEPKLIPAFKAPNGNSINVVFVGDVTNKCTIERFHTWAAYLMEQKMPGIGSPWYSISKVDIYGILLRPDSTTVCDDVMTKEVKGFLNELASLEQMDVNHRPFEHVLFLQSPEGEGKRAVTVESLCLTAYHIARTDGKCFEQNNKYCFHDANTTGVFYEADVQKELDAYNLSQILLSDFIANEGRDFLDVKEAERLVSDSSDYLDSLTPKSISKTLTSGFKCPKDVRIKRPYHPLNILKLHKVWHEYYGDYIVNLKRNLVNNLRRSLILFQENYNKELAQRQLAFIKESTNALQELVFQMFCDTGSRDRFRHIGIPQSLKVLEVFENRIVLGFSDDSKKAKAFDIPKDLLDAAAKANANHWDSGHVLDVLTDRLQRLPLYNLARLLRVLLLGAIIGGMLSLYNPLGMLAIPLVLIVDIIVFNSKVKRIEALKDQYVGMKLIEMRDILDKQVDLMINKSKEEMQQYITWLRINKLEYLQKSLSVITAPAFQFNVSEVFQPLVSCSSKQAEKPKVLIPASSLKSESMEKLLKSGSFGIHPLTKNVPVAQIYASNGGTCSIYDLINGKKDIVQQLVQQLMREHQHVTDGVEEQVEFKVHETSSQNMLLILDVSGSMSGKPLEELKKYVKGLSAKGEVEWIAFSDDVCCTSRDADADKLESVAGTCYIPAIHKAVEWLENGATYDSIIIISDGYPFETVDEIVDTAEKLNQPLNTISIGEGAESVLVDIALRTGGEEITIESFDDLSDRWDNEILPRISALDDGNYSFGNLLKKSQIAQAAKALHEFSLKQLSMGDLSLPQLIVDYGDDDGLREWVERTRQRNTINQGATQHAENDCCSVAQHKDNDRMKQKMSSFGVPILVASVDEPDMIASLLTEQPLDKIGDLQWAQSLNADDQSVNCPELLKKVMEENHVKSINVYNNELNAL